MTVKPKVKGPYRITVLKDGFTANFYMNCALTAAKAWATKQMNAMKADRVYICDFINKKRWLKIKGNPWQKELWHHGKDH